jgi:hypothetical protein
MNSRLPKRSTVPGWRGHWRLPIWSLTGSCSSTRSRPLPGAPTVDVSKPGGSRDRRVNCRRVPQPRWVGARRNANGGEQPEGDRRGRWKPTAFVLAPRPGRVCLQLGVTSVHAGGSERPCASAVPSFPARPTLCRRALDLPFIGVRRGSRCTMRGCSSVLTCLAEES